MEVLDLMYGLHTWLYGFDNTFRVLDGLLGRCGFGHPGEYRECFQTLLPQHHNRDHRFRVCWRWEVNTSVAKGADKPEPISDFAKGHSYFCFEGPLSALLKP